jgi:glycogen(starch) synthase
VTADAAERAPAGVFLFEASTEVCNQVGGIYQVIRSKAETIVERWGDRYILVGPYVEAKAALEFEPMRPSGWLGRLVAALAEEGLKVHHGRWLIPGNPRTLLIEHWQGQDRLAQAKFRLWKDHFIESPKEDWWIDGAVSFGDALRRLIEHAVHLWAGAGGPKGEDKSDKPAAERRVLLHCHEWLGGLALPMLRHQKTPVGCIFTTHATLLGRYLASNDDGLYDHLPWLDGEREAARFNVTPQFRMEKACAHASHVFTAVSSITGEECQQLLSKGPDVVTPNGLNIAQYYAAHEMQMRHAEFKERIHQFVMGHFFPSYSFDLDKTMYFFTSGRYEPRNKGFDLCLESMARLNAELRAGAAEPGTTIVFFIVTSKATRTINPLAMEKRGVLNELQSVCEKITEDLGHQLFRSAASGERIHLDDRIEEYWKLRYKRTQYALRSNRLPMVVTHILEDEANDPVLNQIRALGLHNRPDDPVKVVYHPEFIKPENPLWGMEYEQFVRGCHLGVFPSLYEPWGYTPLECMACGVPAFTSDVAGFGKYVQDNIVGHEELGVAVIGRRGRSYHDAAAEMTRKLVSYCQLRRRERIALRNAVERSSWEFDWGRLATNYHRAHDLALDRINAEIASATIAKK